MDGRHCNPHRGSGGGAAPVRRQYRPRLTIAAPLAGRRQSISRQHVAISRVGFPLLRRNPRPDAPCTRPVERPAGAGSDRDARGTRRHGYRRPGSRTPVCLPGLPVRAGSFGGSQLYHYQCCAVVVLAQKGVVSLPRHFEERGSAHRPDRGIDPGNRDLKRRTGRIQHRTARSRGHDQREFIAVPEQQHQDLGADCRASNSAGANDLQPANDRRVSAPVEIAAQ